MTYDCRVRALVRNAPPEFGLLCEANTRTEAAREAARQVAKMIFGDKGEAGFLSEEVDGEYLATVGEQYFREGGLTTAGCSVAIRVAPHA